MAAGLYWIDGVWPGRLGLATRPRGGDWLEDSVAAWRRLGVTMVCSLLTPEEERDLNLTKESYEANARNIRFLSLPIADREVPKSEADVTRTLKKLDAELGSGGSVLVHCRQGVGRAGLIASSLLIMNGWTVEAAIRMLTTIRGVQIPETEEQRLWIERYAAMHPHETADAQKS